jgi:FAD/FMN-containing dehydrogenase
LRVANVFHAGDGNLHPLIRRATRHVQSNARQDRFDRKPSTGT